MSTYTSVRGFMEYQARSNYKGFSAEHGKWLNFYRADWLTNIKSTIYSLDAIRKYVRMQGDSPDFFIWYKELLMPENEKKKYLENTHRKPLSDDELAEKLKEKLLN